MCEDERDYENGLPNILLQFVELTGNSWIYNMQSLIMFKKSAVVPVRISKMIKSSFGTFPVYRSCIALFIERGCLSKTEINE